MEHFGLFILAASLMSFVALTIVAYIDMYRYDKDRDSKLLSDDICDFLSKGTKGN